MSERGRGASDDHHWRRKDNRYEKLWGNQIVENLSLLHLQSEDCDINWCRILDVQSQHEASNSTDCMSWSVPLYRRDSGTNPLQEFCQGFGRGFSDCPLLAFPGFSVRQRLEHSCDSFCRALAQVDAGFLRPWHCGLSVVDPVWCANKNRNHTNQLW